MHAPLCCPDIHNFIASFKHHFFNRGYIDNILLLKSKSHYDYIKDDCFLDICQIFKMCIDGVASGVTLVKKMQPSGDLENVWIIFDHFKCVK